MQKLQSNEWDDIKVVQYGIFRNGVSEDGLEYEVERCR